jgi:excisionase family DNA binding protein
MEVASGGLQGQIEGEPKVQERLTVTEVAQQLGVSVKTIVRWEKAGKIRKAPRDWRGWRVYGQEDILRLKDFFQTVY